MAKTGLCRKIEPLLFKTSPINGFQNQSFRTSSNHLVLKTKCQCFVADTREMFDAALGGVLFIDEAYRLADSTYGAQVLYKIVDMATKEKYMGKMCLILAGYPSPTLKMLKRNPGALGRFGNNIFKIPDPTPAQCAKQFWRHVERLSLSSQAKEHELNDVVMRIIERFSADLEHLWRCGYAYWSRLMDGKEA
jgi:hypothetical protein